MESGKQRQRGIKRNIRLADTANFDDINWHHYTHPELYNMIMMAKPEHVRHRAASWATLGQAIENTTGQVQATLGKLFQTWQGGAADGARVSNDHLNSWAAEASARTHRIGNGLTQYAHALEAARHKMPPPEFAWAEHAAMQGDPFTMVSGPAGNIEVNQLLNDKKPDYDKHHSAWLEAVRVMKTYSQQSQAVHDSMPPPYDPAPTTGQNSAAPNTEFPQWNERPLDRPRPVPAPSGQGQNPVQPGHSGVPGDLDGDGIPDTTTPDSYTPIVAGAGPEAGYGAGGGTFAGPAPGGASGADVATRGTLGAGGLAAGGGANPLAARGGAGAGMPGARGTAGAGSFAPMGAGAGAQREEDKEHTTKYVEGMDWLDELPPAYPPVFGA